MAGFLIGRPPVGSMGPSWIGGLRRSPPDWWPRSAARGRSLQVRAALTHAVIHDIARDGRPVWQAARDRARGRKFLLAEPPLPGSSEAILAKVHRYRRRNARAKEVRGRDAARFKAAMQEGGYCAVVPTAAGDVADRERPVAAVMKLADAKPGRDTVAPLRTVPEAIAAAKAPMSQGDVNADAPRAGARGMPSFFDLPGQVPRMISRMVGLTDGPQPGPDQIAAMMRRARDFHRQGADGPYRFLRAGDPVQPLPEASAEGVALLRLVGDLAPGWLWGGMGFGQFQIAPKGPAAGNWPATRLLMAGH